jgi:hypothetical protein
MTKSLIFFCVQYIHEYTKKNGFMHLIKYLFELTLHICGAYGLKDLRRYLVVQSFLSTAVPRLQLGPTQQPVKWVLWSHSSGDKVSGV